MAGESNNDVDNNQKDKDQDNPEKWKFTLELMGHIGSKE